jgi:hypothetical protein
MTSEPEQVVQRQVEAYNARDIEAFLALYSPDIVVARLPSETVLYTGHAEMRQSYQPLFQDNPELHCQIVSRVSLGTIVVDRENITGFADGRVVHAIAIYEEREGLIQRFWVIRG